MTTVGGAFTGNNASEFGGAVHMESSNASFMGTRFEENNAKFGAAVETFVSEFHVRWRGLFCLSVWISLG